MFTTCEFYLFDCCDQNLSKHAKIFINETAFFFIVLLAWSKRTPAWPMSDWAGKNQGKPDPSGRFALPAPLQGFTAIINSKAVLHTVL